jgi:hypothetical protein
VGSTGSITCHQQQPGIHTVPLSVLHPVLRRSARYEPDNPSGDGPVAIFFLKLGNARYHGEVSFFNRSFQMGHMVIDNEHLNSISTVLQSLEC